MNVLTLSAYLRFSVPYQYVWKITGVNSFYLILLLAINTFTVTFKINNMCNTVIALQITLSQSGFPASCLNLNYFLFCLCNRPCVHMADTSA